MSEPELPDVRSSLGHTPTDDRWAFDASVTEVFDDMLARSIPQYQVMRDLVADVAASYVRPGTDVVDLGCSRGEALATLVRRFATVGRNRFVGVEVSAPMLAAARERFHDEIAAGTVVIADLDLRLGFPPCSASVVLAILSIQFTPIEHRLRIIGDVYDHLVPGGAFVLVEKVIGASAGIDRLLVDLYYRMKQANGYTREEIARKRAALEGVLVPVTSRWNEEMLRGAGFAEVDCIWRWCNFAAWLAVKANDVASSRWLAGAFDAAGRQGR